jgi:hypothetical protein
MNLNEIEISTLVDALECKLYDIQKAIRELKKRENPSESMLNYYQSENDEIKDLLIKLDNLDTLIKLKNEKK